MKKIIRRIVSGSLSAVITLSTLPALNIAGKAQTQGLYEKGNFVNSYNAIISRHTDKNSRSWRDGMISGNGKIGYVTSGEPYSDAFIFQNMYFNYPSADPREIPAELPGQLEEARLNVFNLNDRWEIKDANGRKRSRTFLYSYHPGHQLRLTSSYTDTAKDYIRWTNYETAETGVKFSDKYGEWFRTSFTSRTDNVSITKLTKSDQGELINMVISIDDIDDMCKAWNGLSAVSEQRYKKIVPEDCEYIAQIAHYPVYNGSELYDGGYGGVTMIIAEGENASKTRVTSSVDDPMLKSENAAVQIKNAEAVYLITSIDRSFDMTEAQTNVMEAFESADTYNLLDELIQTTRAAAQKYTTDGNFDYDAALVPSSQLQKAEFNRLSFELEGDEEFVDYDNNALIDAQRQTKNRINHEFMRRSYEQARYAMICCGGSAAPRLCGMWTGEWNPGWRGIYTLDANVNLQVSPMNTGNLGGDFQLGYISFFLRHAPDFMQNATMAYGMHDAIQLSVNVDVDRGMHVEYDNAYPFEYWNAGASWCLLPIYEYWQCYGNQQIPINEYMRFDDLQKVLGVNDGGLTDEEFAELKERGYLDLEKDILLPLLTKQANFWEQIVTPRYYTDINGNACHDESKTELEEGEKYIIIPTYSPENNPIGYSSTLTANATMDIAAARDGLDMVCAMENALKREGYEAAVEKWTNLKNSISDYKMDTDGALREWAMSEYMENNNHRHLSHLYVAWPGYETQTYPELAEAANIALDNRNRYNTSDATAGHGWMHKALVEARLKRGNGMMSSLLMMMTGTAYYSSLMTDHDTNRRNDTYCTDTAFGTVSSINEALLFSNTGEIELIPALPGDWVKGSIKGLMARTRMEVTDLSWDLDNSYAKAELLSLEDNNTVRMSCREAWESATLNGEELEIQSDENGRFVGITLNNNETASVEFKLRDVLDGTYTITSDNKYLGVDSTQNGSEAVWTSTANSGSYWNVKNTEEGFITIQSCMTGKYLTNEDGVFVQKNYTGEANQLWSGTEFEMNRLAEDKDVTVTPDSIAITADGIETDSISMQNGEKIKLGIKIIPEDAKTNITWKSSSIGNGVVGADNSLTAHAPGEFYITAVSDAGYSVTARVNVTGNSWDITKAEPTNITSADSGYNSSWVPQNAFDGIASTSYSSKDDTAAKYLQAEFAEPIALTSAAVIGRYTSADGNGAFANRINGAKIYASNSDMRGNPSNGVYVGEVTTVTATSDYIPQQAAINTSGEKYKYYMLYFNTINNGSNISFAVGELAFYTGGASTLKKISPSATSSVGNPVYAVDGNVSTVYTILGQTADTAPEQYIQFEFDGENAINKIVIKKAILSGESNYWADWCLSVGCELQGSFDGEAWETIAQMNPVPDGTDNSSEAVFEFTEPKAYKYIRYIRTKIKTSSDYASWKWTDFGNRISLADIEFYTVASHVVAEVVNKTETSITVIAQSNASATYNMFVAVYDENGMLTGIKLDKVDFEEFIPQQFEIENNKNTYLFFWEENMMPVSNKISL